MTGVKRVSAYQTSDGQTFDKKNHAEAHEATLRLKHLLIDEHAPGQCWDDTDLYNWMTGQGWRLINLLSDIARRHGT